MIRTILTYPNKILITACEPIADEELAMQIEQDLFDSLPKYGAGIAAPQIGYLYRIFVMKSWPKAFVNPSLFLSENTKKEYERCLSLPGQSYSMSRATKIRISYSTTDNLSKTNTKKMRNWDARVAQHEFDHLSGKLIGMRENE